MSNDWTYILKLMREGENDQVKFFGRAVSDQLLGEAISAMANSNGGLIVIGIDVANYHLVGSPVDLNWVHKAVLSQLTPATHLRIDRIKRDEKEILIIHVPLGENPPYQFQDKTFVRDQHVTREATAVELSELKPRAFAKIAAQSHEFWLLHPPESLDENRLETAESELDADSAPVGTCTPLLVELVPDSILDSSPVLALEHASSQPEEVAVSLNSRQKQTISFLKTNGRIKNMEYRSLFQVSHKTAHLELVDLVARGLLATQGKGRSTSYILNASPLIQV